MNGCQRCLLLFLLLISFVQCSGCRTKDFTGEKPEILPEKLLVFGIDAASWVVLDPIIKAGHLPTIEKLIENGTKKSLETLSPTVSVMLWTTIATGMKPEKHGIKSWLVEGADTSGQLAITSEFRKVPAIWNWATPRRCLFSNWWATWPAESIDGVMISNRAHFPNLNHIVHPPSYRDTVKGVKPISKQDLDAELTQFNPDGTPITLSEFNYQQLRKDRFYLDSAAAIMDNESFDITGLFVRGIDILEHEYLYQVLPFANQPAEEDSDKGIVLAYYRYLDNQLHRFMELLGNKTVVVLVSDHGMDPVGKLPPLIEGLNMDKLLMQLHKPSADDHSGNSANKLPFKDNKRHPPGLTRGLSWSGSKDADLAVIKEHAAALKQSLETIYMDSIPLFQSIRIEEDFSEIMTLKLNPEPSPNSIIKFNDQSLPLLGIVNFIIHPKAGQHWHAPDGIFLVSGPGIVRSKTEGTIPIQDVAPTMAGILGIPLAKDMDGKPHLDCYTPELLSSRPLKWVETHGTRTILPSVPSDQTVDRTVKNELRSLGYIQ
jgi:predicted AlkP superfamily phosphohydrolase/phosphomutase